MGSKFQIWRAASTERPQSHAQLKCLIQANRAFSPIAQLAYGDYGLFAAKEAVARALRDGRRIALYADYDVDGTMSCVSWIWYLRAIGYSNFTYYIPDRFREGYGLNLKAIEHLIDKEGAQLIITMDTGITANAEAELCRSRGVDFICTDHHKIQPDKMPDCIILNPKLHPSTEYQELCGCGITFVLLRQLAQEFPIAPDVWTDLLALTGMATICDVVPLNGVNHRLAQMGVNALLKSRRPVLQKLMEASAMLFSADEKDIGFRLGPRINAVGRLEHAGIVVRAFVEEHPDQLIQFMGECNEKRKRIQQRIVEEALAQAEDFRDDPVLFLGGDWHQGVVGIAASKVAEAHWKPTWLFHRGELACKGSARSIQGFDVTEAMVQCGRLFEKFGGHRAAGGFSFSPDREADIRSALLAHAGSLREQHPELWQSVKAYDCELPMDLASLDLANELGDLKPFGHAFEEPVFMVRAAVAGCQFYRDKATGEPRHTALSICGRGGQPQKVMFFNEVHADLQSASTVELLVTASANTFRGETSLQLSGVDYRLG